MNAYIGVAHARQVGIARAEGFVAFSHGREASVRSLNVGDRVAYYAPKSDWGGAHVQAFVALALVTGEDIHTRQYEMGTGHVRAARYFETRDAPVRPLLPELSFVTDPKHWGLAFRQGKFRITEEDYAVIARAMGVSR